MSKKKETAAPPADPYPSATLLNSLMELKATLEPWRCSNLAPTRKDAK